MLGNVVCEASTYFLTEDTKVIYTDGDASAYKAATNLVKHFKANGINNAEAVSANDSVSAGTAVYVISEAGDCSVSLVNGQLTFKGESAQLVKLIEYYISLGFFDAFTYTFSCTADDLGYGFTDGTITTANNTYSYVWGDEFNIRALDATRWNWSTADSRMQGYSDNGISSASDYIYRCYEAENDGFLRLTSKADGDGTFTSPASFSTHNRMAYSYGYAEIRARLPYTKGAWPSFWAVSKQPLGVRNTTTYGTEIDVFEVYGEKTSVEAALHKWYIVDNGKCTGCGGTEKGYLGGLFGKCDRYPCHESAGAGSFDSSTIDTSIWHTYGFEWTPTAIYMYIDGMCYASYDLSKDLERTEGNDDMAGFSDPVCIIFNNHALSPLTCENMGVTGVITEDIMNTFVANYDIDYFRLYQNDSIQGTKLYTE